MAPQARHRRSCRQPRYVQFLIVLSILSLPLNKKWMLGLRALGIGQISSLELRDRYIMLHSGLITIRVVLRNSPDILISPFGVVCMLHLVKQNEARCIMPHNGPVT